jgi:kinase-associated protein B
MENKQLEIGQIVLAEYKTGVYVGEIVDLSTGRATVKMLAVIKHPTQGDLHNPFQGDVPFFHQRKALAYLEKALVPLSQIRSYQGEIPEYKASLAKALEKEILYVQQQSGSWAERAFEALEQLRAEYFPEAR